MVADPAGVAEVDFRQRAMIRLSVVKEKSGWSIRIGERMCSPFWRRDKAIREARRLAAAIRSHGEQAEVIVEGEAGGDAERE